MGWNGKRLFFCSRRRLLKGVAADYWYEIIEHKNNFKSSYKRLKELWWCTHLLHQTTTTYPEVEFFRKCVLKCLGNEKDHAIYIHQETIRVEITAIHRYSREIHHRMEAWTCQKNYYKQRLSIQDYRRVQISLARSLKCTR